MCIEVLGNIGWHPFGMLFRSLLCGTYGENGTTEFSKWRSILCIVAYWPCVCVCVFFFFFFCSVNKNFIENNSKNKKISKLLGTLCVYWGPACFLLFNKYDLYLSKGKKKNIYIYIYI